MIHNWKDEIKKAWGLMAIIALLAVSLPANAVFAKDNTSDTQDTSVVIYLDGHICSLSDFISISKEFDKRGTPLFSIIEPGIMHSFTSMENLSKEYVVSFAKPKGSAAMLDSIDPGYAYNWVDANGGGNCSAIQEGWDGNLSSEWRNVISSITYPYGGDSWLNGYMCWTGLNKSGSWDIFLKCPPYHKYELSGLIYNDNFESVAFCNVSPQ